jgi:hypothetical protein
MPGVQRPNVGFRQLRTSHRISSVLLSAKSRLMHRSKRCARYATHYSITSSASASSVGGMSRPSAFAVLRLITIGVPSPNLFDCVAGNAPDFSVLRTLPT